MVNEVGCWQTETMTAAATLLLLLRKGGWLLESSLMWLLIGNQVVLDFFFFDKFGNDFKDVVAVEVRCGSKNPF